MHDYVIVGAGTAGCVLASRLTEDPGTSVLLLEAGPRDRKLEIRVPAAFSKLYRSKVDWGLSTVPQAALDDREIVFPLGRVVGGSSSLNAMMCIRGRPEDQAPWGPGWEWPTVEPLYARGAAGPFRLGTQTEPNPLSEAFLDACAEVGIQRVDDVNGGIDGAALVPVSQHRGRRYSAADGYLRPALHRPNLTVATRSHVSRIVLDGTRVVGVETDGGDLIRAEHEVILSAGAIGSPRLLLLSGIGPADELRAIGVTVTHPLPGVGKGLRDHIANGILAATKTGVKTLADAESVANLARWALRRRGPLTSNVAEAAAFVRTDATLPGPDLELIFAPVPFEDEGLVTPSRHGVTIAAVCLQPRSIGEVTLRTSDPGDPPLIDPRYLTDADGADATTLLHGIRLAREVLAASPLAESIDGEYLPGPAARTDDDLRAHLRARSQTLYHPVGTCRLGGDEQAVVDAQLRVRGLDGLRIVDASVMPALPRGHTNWPTVMVAERASDLIRGGATTAAA